MSTFEALNAEFATEPYSGDDLPQTMARTMWWMVLAMGVMLVVGSLALGAYSGVKLGNFFHLGLGAADDYGRAQSTTAWVTGVNFFGMGLILSSITMILVNIARTLRDAGRDVQEAVGSAEVLKLHKPIEARLVPHVMAAGVMILATALAFGAVVATKLGAIPAAQLARGAAGLTGDNLTRFGVAQAFSAWLGPLRFVGLAVVFVSIVLALRTIIATLRYQSFRLVELTEPAAYEGREEAHAANGHARSTTRMTSKRRAAGRRSRAS